MSMSTAFLKAIVSMRETNSLQEKERILQRLSSSPTFKMLLFQTYSPYIRYHIRKIPAVHSGRGYKDLGTETWDILNRLSLRKITGNVARETLFEHLESLTSPAERLLRLVIAKDLKCGIAATTINKVFPGLIPTFDCQLVDDWDEARVQYPILVGPKIDCVRGEYRNGQFFTRRGHKVVGVDHIIRYIHKINPKLEFSGELYIPGMPFNRASGIIRSNKASKPNVRLACFDIPNLDIGTYGGRHEHMAEIMFPLGTDPHPEVVYIPHVLCHTNEQVTALFKKWVLQGWEGLVAKNPKGKSLVGKGSYDWMRLVYGGSAEFRVVNVYESTEMPNMLGGVILPGNIKVGSGFDEDERRRYWADPNIILGRMATIDFKERTKAGSLRQPIWKGIRWDI